jgi:hypothetical protein
MRTSPNGCPLHFMNDWIFQAPFIDRPVQREEVGAFVWSDEFSFCKPLKVKVPPHYCIKLKEGWFQVTKEQFDQLLPK